MPVDEEVLVLKEAAQSFVIPNVPESPLVSLLQDFSAPVSLVCETSVADGLKIFQFETNGYSKWDAGLRLAQQVLTRCYREKDEAWQVDADLLKAYQATLLNQNLDGALRAELLTPPGFELIAAELPRVDVARLEAVRDYFRVSMAHALEESATGLYQVLWAEEDHAMHGVAYSRRRLRNVCLGLMMRTEHTAAYQYCEQQFRDARTMTDQLASVTLLAHCANEEARLNALARFYQQWRQDELVMDKWFSIQASCPLPGALARVESLMQHPLFNLKNPNKVRALIGSFCQANLRHFHAVDGSGYAFLTDLILKLDAINPHISGRLVTPFTRWQRVDEPRQTLILAQLERLARVRLSTDLQELVQKSLVLS
ncbi:MAG: hypothetical protein B7X00_01495 [Legionella sp. 21-45-4]|nr:MAG: hypothetical protein B7X00_01495 [Legionella sp. 21-45-4]